MMRSGSSLPSSSSSSSPPPRAGHARGRPDRGLSDVGGGSGNRRLSRLSRLPARVSPRAAAVVLYLLVACWFVGLIVSVVTLGRVDRNREEGGGPSPASRGNLRNKAEANNTNPEKKEGKRETKTEKTSVVGWEGAKVKGGESTAAIGYRSALWHYGSDRAMDYESEARVSLPDGGSSAEEHALASSGRVVRVGGGRGASAAANGTAPGSEASIDMIDMRILASTLPFDNPDGGAWKQGFDVEPVPLFPRSTADGSGEDDPARPLLRVFVVPHSHCDPGWVKTFDDYFQTQTRNILTSVYQALMEERRRTFIWAEISYFEWWWREQPVSVRKGMRNLIRNRQFEFVTGGWVQPDEANTQRYAIEVQLQEGRDWLRATFLSDGAHDPNDPNDPPLTEEFVLPRYGWSIDPFGYSPTMADVLHDYGFKGMLIQRVHYAVKKRLAERRHLEFKWRQTWDPDGTHDIFTHVMPFYSYDVPHTCGPDPSVCCQFDFARLKGKYGGCPWKKTPKVITSSNVAERAETLLDQYRRKAALYRSNVVLAPLGDDFRYRSKEEAESQYTNYQKMFDYMNRPGSGVVARFGTLRDYFEAVKGTFDPPILKGSFFTYSDVNEDYWSGYFTTRPFDKALDRQLERALYAASSMGATRVEMRRPRRALSLFQHHDGVTGTAKSNVVEDYAQYVRAGIEESRSWMAKKLAGELGMPGPLETAEEFRGREEAEFLGPCWRTNQPRDLGRNYCEEEQGSGRNNNATVYAYNPLDSEQRCGDVVVPGLRTERVTLPCETPGLSESEPSNVEEMIKFGPDGRLIYPFREEWMLWRVQRGGAYLFFPGTVHGYTTDVKIERGGYVVSTSEWKRTIYLRSVPGDTTGSKSHMIDLQFETNLKKANEEWFVRLTAPIDNGGVFHTDLNGFNFDTHYFRKDLPIQSQVFPMPTMSSIEDGTTRMTVISEHAQGTASLNNGTIDVWLDRYLVQDDKKGLGQGVKDTVPTRTKLRVLIETSGYDTSPPAEFAITDFCQEMWNELNHPLELFGLRRWDLSSITIKSKEGSPMGIGPPKNPNENRIVATKVRPLPSNLKIPFVYMVHKNVNFFNRALESLRSSDFPVERVAIIVSHDGKVPAMMAAVDELRKWGMDIIQIFNPLSCFDNPDSFPANDAKLNENYTGDQYGNKRSSWATCSKHHFAWTLKTVRGMNETAKVDAVVFLEEHDLVAPTIFETAKRGLDLINNSEGGIEYFGASLEGEKIGERGSTNFWHNTETLSDGPLLLKPAMLDRIMNFAEEFCTFDEYNWELSLVYLQALGHVPHAVLMPSDRQSCRIGKEGMHYENEQIEDVSDAGIIPLGSFHSANVSLRNLSRLRVRKGNGGFGHQKDHEHCISVLSL